MLRSGSAPANTSGEGLEPVMLWVSLNSESCNCCPGSRIDSKCACTDPGCSSNRAPLLQCDKGIEEVDVVGSRSSSPMKKSKIEDKIPGLLGTTIDENEPLDCVIAPCQYPEALARYRNLPDRYTSYLVAFPSSSHTENRGLSFVKAIKLVTTYGEA